MCMHFETALKEEWEKEKKQEEEDGERGGPCSFLDGLLEEIKQDMPRLRLMGMLRSLDDRVESLCAAASPAADVASALSEIQREMSTADAGTKAAACHHLSIISRRLLASPAAAAAAPDGLVLHLAQDLVSHLASDGHLVPDAITEAARVLAASPSVAVPVLFKPLVACLASPDPRASTAAAVAFCELLAPPADAAPFLPLAHDLHNLLTTSGSNAVLINVLKVLTRLASRESSLDSQIVDTVRELLDRSSDMFLTFQCIRTMLAARPAHGARLAIRKVKDFLAGACDPNLGLLALGMLYPGFANECRDVIALLLNDVDSNIRREALHLLMEMVDSDTVMGIASMLVSHAAKLDDPEFANEIARQLVDVGLRVQVARPGLVHAARMLLIDTALLGDHLLYPVLSAAACVSGEYVEFSKDPVELAEALLQPRTSLLPMSVRAVYIQAVHKVITFCCNLYLEGLADSNKELDVVFNGLAIDQTVSGGTKAAIGPGEEQIVREDFFSEKSILHMIKLVEEKIGPLVKCNEVVECNEVEVLEIARNLIGFVHLIKEIQEVSDDDKCTQAKELVKNLQTVFSQELSHVSVKSHPSFSSMTSKQRDHDNDPSINPPETVGKEPRKHRGFGGSGQCKGKHKQRGKSITQPDVVPRAACIFETNIRQHCISAGTFSHFGDAQRFESVFKMKRRTFNYICWLVKPVEDISSYTLLDGRVLLLEDQVAIALRMFRCGAPVETVLSDVGVSRSTFGLIFWRFVDAMLKQASHLLCWPDSMKMESTKSKFEVIHGMPNCCGVVDTTCITTRPSAEPNCDHEKNHNITVQAVVDLDARIINSFVGLSDSILHSSFLFKQCENGLWLNGSKLKLSDGSEAGEYLIGDAGYPLLRWLLTPYQEKDLSGPKLEFNRRHSAARTIAQGVLASLKDTWMWMHGGGPWGLCPQELLPFSAKIIDVCCVLHNIVIDMEGAQEHVLNNHDMNYRRQVCQLADKNAVSVRDILSQRLADRSSKFGGTLSFPEDEQRFENFFQMKRRTFKYICCLAKSIEDVSSDTFLDGRAMCLEDQVAVSLRMLISGGPLETVASDFSISESIVSVVTCRFVEAMMMRAGYHERWPDSIEMEKIKSKFELIFGLPNCCGVIDTTYITTLRLSSVESNRENEINYRMAVQVVVDPDMRFTNVHVVWPGRERQSRIVHNSLIRKQREKGEWLTGSKLKISDGSEVAEYIIGDAGYALLPWLLTPYRGKNLSDPKVEFNRRLSAARDVTLRGLARLKDTWKCLHGKLRPENRHEFGKVIRVCCMLHNIVIDMEGKAMEEEYVPNSDVKYTDVYHYHIPDENAVRTRNVLSQHLASSSSKSLGEEEEQEASGRKAEEEAHCQETVLAIMLLLTLPFLVYSVAYMI